MKTPFSIFLCLVLLGCSAGSKNVRLTSEQARDVARNLANAKAQTLFACEPFSDGPSARFDEGHWVWHDRRGRGNADYEATVELAANGKPIKVNVDLLYSTPLSGGF